MNMIFHCLWFLWFPFRWIIFPRICRFVLSLVFLLASVHSNNDMKYVLYIVVDDGLLNHPVSISLQFACASAEAFANRVEEAYKSRTMADCLLRPLLHLRVSLCFSLCFLSLVDWYYMTEIRSICSNMYVYCIACTYTISKHALRLTLQDTISTSTTCQQMMSSSWTGIRRIGFEEQLLGAECFAHK